MLFILVFVLRWQAEDNVSKGKLRLAVEEYNAALALDPNHLAHNVHLHLGLCKVLVKLGRGKDAVTSCNEALNIDGDLIEALVQVCLFFWPSSLWLSSFRGLCFAKVEVTIYFRSAFIKAPLVHLSHARAVMLGYDYHLFPCIQHFYFCAYCWKPKQQLTYLSS